MIAGNCTLDRGAAASGQSCANRTLHVVNCNGMAPPVLEKREGERWVLEGTYRLVWPGVLYDFDATRYPFGEEVELELRTAEEFFIDDPRF